MRTPSRKSDAHAHGNAENVSVKNENVKNVNIKNVNIENVNVENVNIENVSNEHFNLQAQAQMTTKQELKATIKRQKLQQMSSTYSTRFR